MKSLPTATPDGTGLTLRLWAILAVNLIALTGGRALAVTVYDSGTGGYNTYRIPAIVRSTNGTLLAFCEGRRNSAADDGDIEIVLKRSTDNGATWGAPVVVQDEGTQTIHNPAPIVDEVTGRIHLLFCRNYLDVFYTYSDDDGVTWSARRDITTAVKLPGWGTVGTGPGHGIQLKRGNQAGRLVVPTWAAGKVPNFISLDHGTNWDLGAYDGSPLNVGEPQAVELVQPGGNGNSRLYYNARENGTNSGTRAQNWSVDGASTYAGDYTNNLQFICPMVQGSVARMRGTDEGDAYNLLVFSCPNAPDNRINLSVWYSVNEGLNWSDPKTIDAGNSGYSDMVRLSNGNMGILYENGSPPALISFTTFSTSFLGLPADPNQPPAVWDGGAGAGSTNWGTAANWEGNVLPVFDGSLAVNFYKVGSANLANCIGADRTVRLLNFTADADSAVNITLSDGSGVGKILTFNSYAPGENASLTVSNGAAGNFIVGVGGGSGPGSITLADNLVVTHNGTGELRFDRPVSGPGGVTKNGAGILFLRQSNPYTGSTVINAGVVVTGGNTGGFGDANTSGSMLINGGTLANSTGASRPIYNNVTVGGNFTVGGVAAYGSGLLTFSGAFDLGGATRILTVNSPVTLAGVVSNGGVTKAGSNTLALAGASTYTGMNTIFTGVLQLGTNGPSGSLAAASAIAIAPGATFQFNRSDNLTAFANSISGSGTVLKSGNGEVGLAGVNTFSGLIDIQAGRLAFSGANSENGSPSINVAATGTLSLGDGFVGGGATIANLSGAGLLNGSFGLNAGTRTLQVNQTADGTFSGTIADGTSGRILALTKTGSATLTLSGTNTYTGHTTVSNGTVLVNGSLGNTAVTVKGGTLGGTGTISGAVSVQPGGMLSPGASIGTLTINNSLTLDPAATVFMEFNATNGQSDRAQGLTAASYAGSLVVSNVAGPANLPILGQAFMVFSAVPCATGSFSSITPALASGLAWRFTPTNGLLSVVPATATYPTNISYSFYGGTLSLTWPATHLGWIAQSNIVSVANTNYWFDIPGSSSVTNLNVIPSLAWTNVFYHLRSP